MARGFRNMGSRFAREAVARITGRTEVFDFAAEVAVTFPMRVTMHILGLPATDDQFILKLARGLTGAEDPDRALLILQRSRYGLPGSACATLQSDHQRPPGKSNRRSEQRDRQRTNPRDANSSL